MFYVPIFSFTNPNTCELMSDHYSSVLMKTKYQRLGPAAPHATCMLKRPTVKCSSTVQMLTVFALIHVLPI